LNLRRACAGFLQTRNFRPLCEPMTDRLPNRTPVALYPVIAVVILATLLAIVRWFKYSPSYTNDSWEYLGLGRAISQGTFFKVDNGFRTPLFPLYLALTGNRPRRMFAGHLALGVLISVLLFLVFKQTTGRTSIGLTVVALYNLNPSTVLFEARVLTETLATLFVTLGTFFAVCACSRRAGFARGLVLSSLAFSMASLTRPEYQLLPLVVIVVVITLTEWGKTSRQPVSSSEDSIGPSPTTVDENARSALEGGGATPRSSSSPATFHGVKPPQSKAPAAPQTMWRVVSAALIPFIVLVLGWSAVNYVRFGWFTLTTMTGYHLTQYSGPYLKEAPPQYQKLTAIYLRNQDIELHLRNTHVDAFWRARPELLKATGLTDAQLSRLFIRISLPIILAHPGAYLTPVKRSWQVFWRPPLYARGCNLGDLRKGLREVLAGQASWWDRLFNYVYLPFEYAYILAFVGPLFLKRWRTILWSPGVLLINTVIVYTAVITSLFEPEDNNRFKVPVESLILGLAVTALYLTAKELRDWRKRGLMGSASAPTEFRVIR
jgi:hypothetical protein